jgi:hypothetical protein
MICECCQAATTSDEACYLMASIVCGECFLADNGVILDKCLTVCNNDTDGATSSTNERGY